MRPATIRRLLVFGVCLVGVGCLYLVPSRAGAPHQVGATAARSDLQTVGAPSPTVVIAISAEPTSGDPADVTDTGARTPTRSTTGQQPARRPGDQQTRERAAATAAEPGSDRGDPPEVGRPRIVSADPERLVISWPEVDDADLVGYEVWLNGFFVVTVQQPRARLVWFNDSDTHVIQVRAFDAAGHEGPSSPTLLVRRPTPSPEPSTTTLPAASPRPTQTGTTPTTDPSTAPPAHDDNADAPLDQTISPSSSAEAGG